MYEVNTFGRLGNTAKYGVQPIAQVSELAKSLGNTWNGPMAMVNMPAINTPGPYASPMQNPNSLGAMTHLPSMTAGSIANTGNGGLGGWLKTNLPSAETMGTLSSLANLGTGIANAVTAFGAARNQRGWMNFNKGLLNSQYANEVSNFNRRLQGVAENRADWRGLQGEERERFMREYTDKWAARDNRNSK